MAGAATDLPWGVPVPRDAAEARAYALADGIWRLRLPLPYQGVRSVNAYVLARADGCCLVDCGSGIEPGWDAFVGALAQAGYEPSDVRVLVCTHTHSDHYGLAGTLVERTGCELWTAPGTPAAVDILRDPVIPEGQRRESARRVGVPADRIEDHVGSVDGGDGHHERPEPARRLHDGDVVEAGGIWHVLETPGHARNHIALHAPDIGWTITADLVLDGDLTYLEYGYGGDPVSENVTSLGRALALRPTRLLPGHGRPVEDAMGTLMAGARAVVERLARTADLLGDDPRTPYAVALELAGGVDTSVGYRQTVMSTTLCDLDHLARTGRARRKEDGDGVEGFVRCHR